jgi:alpha-1,3-mannosyltransferase
MALSIKMSILLYLPGLLVISFKRGGLLWTLRHLSTIILSQVLLALPFLRDNPWSYFQASFDLQRVFLYKWTVNWRFVDEETFLSPMWAKALLIGHATTLAAFGLLKWCNNDGSVWIVLKRGFRRPGLPAGLVPVTADCESYPYSLILHGLILRR